MPRLEDTQVYDRDEEEDDLLNRNRRRVVRLWEDFIDFAFQGNVLEIAFGLILATMFTALVTSFVSDIVLPPISVLLPLNKNLEEKFAVLRSGANHPEEGYNTLKQAQADGAVVMAYGFFMNRLLNFMGVGFSLYSIASIYQFMSKDPIIKKTIRCQYCCKFVNINSIRCINCTSWLDGREDILLHQYHQQHQQQQHQQQIPTPSLPPNNGTQGAPPPAPQELQEAPQAPPLPAEEQVPRNRNRDGGVRIEQIPA